MQKIETVFTKLTNRIQNQIKIKMAEPSQTEIGLMTQVARQVAFKKSAIEETEITQRALIEAWHIMNGTGVSCLHLMIWDYVEKMKMWKNCNSASVGKYSVIKDYHSAKGKVSKAHFTVNEKYLGSVAKMGDVPVAYDGNFKITKADFKINTIQLEDENTKNIEDLFIGKFAIAAPSTRAVAAPARAPAVAAPAKKAKLNILKPKSKSN